MRPGQTTEINQPAREPAFNAPWTIVVLCLGLIGLYGLQSASGADALIDRYGLSPRALASGRWWTLVTSIFLHISWIHVLMNSAVAFAFGTPVARLFGSGPRGASAFAAFFLVCGVIGGLGLVAMDPGERAVSVGASGAVSGLLGAAVRLIAGRGKIGPLRAPATIGFTLVWAVGNYVLGAFGLTPGAIGIPVAWQAHLAGYFAGLLLIGPFASLAGRRNAGFTY